MDLAKNVLGLVYRPIQHNKWQFLLSVSLALGFALILSLTFGESYDWTRQRLRGAPKKAKRQVAQQPDAAGYKDPFPNRPRIQTKNGHLIIEASQDKNIDFKTSGSRGTITINGMKLDQLLNVTKAIEKTFKQNGSRSDSKSSGDPYEMILENIYLSDGKLLKLERQFAELKELFKELNTRLRKNSKEVSKVSQETRKIGKKQDTLLTRLNRNDCVHNETGVSICKNGATCIDSYDGFRCLCPLNFEGSTCEQDVDECAKFRNTDLGCQNGARCINLVGSYRCECTPQYHGVHCTEQHEDCSLSSSRSLCGFGKCINLARTVANQANYECLCDQGWTTDGKSPACVIDINECLVGQSYGLNTSMDSSAPWSNSLMAAYPCSQNPYVECINLPGSFQCAPCPTGYTGNGRVCRDIDECATNNGGCSTSPQVDCINTQGSRQCGPCPIGFAGDGVTCNPTTACSLLPNGGCHPMAKCLDLRNASSNDRLCYCQFPYEGDGVGINGCKLSAGAANFTSINATDPFVFPALKQDDCHPNPCMNGAECSLTDASYECVCPVGRSGKRCETIMKCGGDLYSSRGNLKFPLSGAFNDPEFKSSKNVLKTFDRHYDCFWRISVATNMSIQLLFNELTNKVNPATKIQMYLANSTDAPTPTCTESLDVRERLDADPSDMESLTSSPSYRLIARFCPDARGTKLTNVNIATKKPLPIVVESNTIDLEYTFSKTRTQFGEPSLAFDMNWTSIEPPCGGELAIAESGSISSPRFPEFYRAGIECRYLIRVLPGHRVRLQFGELNLLTGRPGSSSCSDSLTIIDGAIGSERPVIFKHCANNSTLMGKSQNLPSFISSSSAVEVVLVSRSSSSTPSMRPRQKQGFYLTYSSESTLPGCGGLFTQKSTTIRSVDYEPSPIDPNQRESSMLALQISRYFEPKDGRSAYPPQDPGVVSSMYDFVIRDEALNANNSNSNSAFSRRTKWYKTRCEYEIRPANQSRDHKIAIDWLDMPGEPVTQTNALSTWSRRLRCNNARLTIYDGKPLDGSNRTEIARFCSGDRYNSSSPLLMPVTSSGHVLLVVYESRLALDDGPSGNDLPTGSIGSGFKLHYSTVCSATYEQQSGEISVDINLDTPECIYHIMLPPNNSISLVVNQRTLDSLTLTDGSCPAQAIFMDGAVQNSRLALIGVERQLKSFTFERAAEVGSLVNVSSRAGDGINESNSSVVKDDLLPDSMQTDTASYWQYTWSPAHDIKEFEVCKIPYLGFDSIWNHMSLMFRMNPKMFESNQSSLNPKPHIRLSVRYQAEPACGGIISEPREGNFVIESTRKISSIDSYPLTSTRLDAIFQQLFTNPCAWILRARPNQAISMEFEAPTNEINKRYNEWLSWKKSHNISAMFNCSSVFQESIELYEPSLNRTRHLCLTELSSNNATAKWTTQSNIVYLKLRNETDGSNSSLNNSVWPFKRPLLTGNLMINTKYKFVSLTNRSMCGGNLLHDSGILTSPRFPFNYPPNMNCTWIIKTSPGQQIRMNFTRFELEKQADCLFDYVELRNGASDQSSLIGRFCNQDLQNRTIVAHSSSMWITFRSDSHLSRSGFEMRYDGALAGCGGKLTTPSGQIDSPNYPQAYAHNSSCEWTIEVSKSNKIDLYVLDLDLSENSSFCQPEGLKTDYLEVFDVAADNSTRSFGKLCNLKEFKQRSFRSSTNKLTIVYRSQVLDNSRGFRLTYRTMCSGPVELAGPQGVIESPGYPTGYMSHLRCDWLIRAPNGSNLTLNITDLEMEESIMMSDYAMLKQMPKPICAADILQIWSRSGPLLNLAGPQANSSSIDKGTQLVQSICGTIDRWTNITHPNLIINLNTSVANVMFESDRSVEAKGFRLEWRSRS